MNTFNFNETAILNSRGMMKGSTSQAARTAFRDMLEDNEMTLTTIITSTGDLRRDNHILNEREVFAEEEY